MTKDKAKSEGSGRKLIKFSLPSAISATFIVASLTFVVTVGGINAAIFFIGKLRYTEELANLRKTSIALLQSAIDPRFQSKAEEIGRVGTRLVVIDALKGASIFDATGSQLETFGERPFTTFNAIRHGVIPAPESSEEARAEFHISPEESQTAYHLLIRVDTSQMLARVAANLRQLRIMSVMIGLLVSLFSGFLVRQRIALPAKRINRIVREALLTPTRAGEERCDIGRRDEIGHLAREIDDFLLQFAAAWRTKVMVADMLLSTSPIGVIQFSDKGVILAANPAAHSLVNLEFDQGGKELPRTLRLTASDQTVSLDKAGVNFGTETYLVEAMEAPTPTYLLASAVANEDTEGFKTTVLLLTDATKLYKERLSLIEERDRGWRDVEERSRRQLELKMMLESCLSLMAPAPSGPDGSIEPMPMAEAWINDAQAVGLVKSAESSVEAPTVSGDSHDIDAVMRLALLTAMARIGKSPVDIVVEGKGINFETAAYTVRARAPAAGAELADASSNATDWNLALAALRVAIKRVKGQMVDFSATDEEVSVRMILRGASERLSTGMAGR
ncbi:hypothetical protein HDIA_0672 [Hartmannibacter diazotrophicus]|uniref:HAMP domain-containing protein n=1 Tax=Hartmannibacter diazotrophicus TaxID=1482074 RepID=A0A2C9D1W8_9HYPH|nr:hypothetical protein [Hartmannibacter diazotrophicus]SON54213.1 hypothetical protein HDIA_0672 [Hartmannibacter diazotrophicus]